MDIYVKICDDVHPFVLEAGCTGKVMKSWVADVLGFERDGLTLWFEGEEVGDGVEVDGMGLIQHDVVVVVNRKEEARGRVAARGVGVNKEGISFACQIGDYHLAEDLITLGVRGAKESMWLAIEHNHPAIVDLITTKYGCTPVNFERAMRTGHKMTSLLLSLNVYHPEPLTYAVTNRLPDRIIEILLPNSTDRTSALIASISRRQYQTTRKILTHKIDVNLKGESYKYPLHHAVEAQSLQTVELLHNHGATLDIRDISNSTPLTQSVANRSHDILLYLLQNGADPNIKGYHESPFEHACKLNDLSTIKTLLSHGADPTLHNPLKYAALHGHFTLVRYLIETLCLPLPSDLIYIPVRRQDVAMVRYFIELGVDCNTPLRGYVTAVCGLFSKCTEATLEILKVLHKGGVDLTLGAPLLAVLQCRSGLCTEDAAMYLVENGCDVNVLCSDNDKSALYLSIENGMSRVVKAILGRGSVDVTLGKRGPLPLAALKNSIEITLMLLEHGVDPRSPTAKGDTALSIAALKGHSDIVEALVKSCNDPDHIETTGACKNTALTQAARKGHTKIVELLLHHGANVNHYNGVMKTPLAYAALSGSEEMVCVLLRYGADPKLRDAERMSPADHATGVLKKMLSAVGVVGEEEKPGKKKKNKK